MKTKTEYECCPQMESCRENEQMELSDTKINCNDDNNLKKEDVCQCTPYQGFTEFCVKSNLHGLRYVGERSNHIFIRLLWALAFVAAVITAIYFIRNVYKKWEESPVIVTVDPRIAEIEEIPFPAVTICPPFLLRKSSANQILNRTSKYFDFNSKVVEFFCKKADIAWHLADNNEKMEFLYDFQEKLRTSCEEIFDNAWIAVQYGKNQYVYNKFVFLTPTATEDYKYCCVFNGIRPQFMYRNISENYLKMINLTTPSFDWNIETGYSASVNRTTMPLRPFRTGTQHGLNFYIMFEDFYCDRRTYFQMAIHHPAEIVEFLELNFLPGTGGKYLYKVTPQLTRSDETLKQVSIKKRNCYFSSEKYLRFYRTYTQKNCFLDCMANLTIQRCNCLPTYLPEIDGIPRCPQVLSPCFRYTYSNVFDGEDGRKCDCLPPCTELKYLVTEQYTPLSHTLQTNLVQLHVHFTESRFFPYHRSAIYTFSEMLANLGGLLGLFLGFSFLSIVEILYFISIAIFKCLQGQYRHLRRKYHIDKCAV